MKSVIVFCAIILGAGQAAAAIKNCEELKSEIAVKLAAAGVSSFVLDIVDKDRIGAGRIIGRCQGGTKRIVRRMTVPTSAPRAGQADAPRRPAASFVYGVKNCVELESEIAAKLADAGISPSVLAIEDKNWAGIGNIVGSCENGTKRIVRTPAGFVSGYGQADIPFRPSVTFAYGIKDCEKLKSEIAAKLVAAGVSSFLLAIENKDWTGGGKVLGSCENGTKKIIRRKGH